MDELTKVAFRVACAFKVMEKIGDEADSVNEWDQDFDGSPMMPEPYRSRYVKASRVWVAAMRTQMILKGVTTYRSRQQEYSRNRRIARRLGE